MLLFNTHKLLLFMFLHLVVGLGFAADKSHAYFDNTSTKASQIEKNEFEYNTIITPDVIIEEISLDFETEINASSNRKLQVEASNLSADIEVDISGDHREKFAYNFEEDFDFRSGGVIFVSYFSDTDESVHQARLTLSSEGAEPKEYELIGQAKHVSGVTNLAIENKVWTEKNKISFYADEGESVILYNINGQEVLQTTAVQGLNAIHIQAKGSLLIKIGNKINKILL